MRKLRLIVIILLAVVAAYTVFGFFVFPYIARSSISKNLGKALERNVSVREIAFNPYLLKMTVKGFTVDEKTGDAPFLALEELKFDLSAMSILKLALVAEEIVIKGPYIRIEQKDKGVFNFSDLIKKEDKKEEKKDGGGTFEFSVSNIQITQGTIDYIDGPMKKTHKVENLDLNIPFVSNFPYNAAIHVEPSFKALVNGSPFSFSGSSLPFSGNRETALSLELKDLDLTRYMDYFLPKKNFSVKSALLDLKAKTQFLSDSVTGIKVKTTGEIILKNISALDKDGSELLTLPVLSIVIGEADFPFRRLHIEKISIDSPVLKTAREKDGILNLTNLIPVEGSGGKDDGKDKVEERTEKGKVRPLILVDELAINTGKVTFLDRFVKGGFETSISDIALKMTGYSSKPETKSAFEISFKADKASALQIKGALCLDPLESNGNISLGPIFLPRYKPYYGEYILFDLQQGNLQLKSDYRFSRQDQGGVQFLASDLAIHINDLALIQSGETAHFFKTPLIALERSSFDLAGREVVLGDFLTKAGSISLLRDKDRILNLGRLFAKGNPNGEAPAKESEDQSRPWTFTLKKALIDEYSIDVTDLSTPTEARIPLRKIRVEAKELSNVKDKKAEVALSFDLGDEGKVKVNGEMAINPPAASLVMGLDAIQAKLFQPYWLPHINLLASKGKVSVQGKCSLSPLTGQEPYWRLEADISLKNLALLERGKAEEFMTLRAMDMKGLAIASPPFEISAQRLSVTGPSCKLHIEKDGTTNIGRLFPAGADEKKPAAKQEDKSQTKVNVRDISVKDGKIAFRDDSISPAYSASLTGIDLSLKGLTSDQFKAADIVLAAKLNNNSPLNLKGKLNPLGKDIFADLTIDFKNIPLSPMTPYSGKYVGYAVEKGNLSLDLKYLIDKMNLQASNKVLLDQFTFGEVIPSPQATTLPVTLAVALLKNRNGLISLDLPVSGKLDDPEFSTGGVILQVIVNLISKALTSPFSLLGAVFGGGEELSRFDFAPGISAVEKDKAQSLDKLIEILYDRPELRVEVEGFADEIRDRSALLDALFLQNLKSLKIKDMTRKGIPIPPLEELSLTPEERALYIRNLFKERGKERPKAKEGKQQDVSLEEMEKALVSEIKVGTDDLRILAIERANAVKSYIVQSGKVPAERIFLVEPKSVVPEKKEGLAASRVDFRLK